METLSRYHAQCHTVSCSVMSQWYDCDYDVIFRTFHEFPHLHVNFASLCVPTPHIYPEPSAPALRVAARLLTTKYLHREIRWVCVRTLFMETPAPAPVSTALMSISMTSIHLQWKEQPNSGEICSTPRSWAPLAAGWRYEGLNMLFVTGRKGEHMVGVRDTGGTECFASFPTATPTVPRRSTHSTAPSGGWSAELSSNKILMKRSSPCFKE